MLNLQTRDGTGVDLQVNYSVELPDAMAIGGNGATLDLMFVSTWHLDDTTVLLAGADPIECAGFLGGTCSGNFIRATPDFRGYFNAAWITGNLNIRTDIEMIGDFELAADAFPNNNVPVGNQFYWDLSGSYDINDYIQVFAGVNNVLDEQPPIIGFRAGGDSNTQAQLYDTVGRRYFLGTRVRFGGQ